MSILLGEDKNPKLLRPTSVYEPGVRATVSGMHSDSGRPVFHIDFDRITSLERGLAESVEKRSQLKQRRQEALAASLEIAAQLTSS